MCGSSHKAIRYRCEMQSIVSTTPCIIDSSFDGSGILEEGNIHFCIHSIAEREAVQKTTACIAWGGRAITEQRASVKYPWPCRFADDNSEVVSDIGEASFWRMSFCVFLEVFFFFHTRMLTWNMMTVYFEISRYGVIDAVESALNSAANYMSECPHWYTTLYSKENTVYFPFRV